MKRIGAIICLLAFVLTMTMGAASAAASLTVEKVSPKDGAKNMAMDNMGFKVYFSEDVYSPENKAENVKHARIVDNAGKEIPTLVLFSKKEKNLMMVLADTNNKKLKIKAKSKYTVEIDSDFVSAKGNNLGTTFTSSFETLNPKSSMWISMGMMGVMVVVMVMATKKGLTDENKRKEDREKKEKEKVNPYKEAKRTGKSVEEIVAKDEKRKQKIAAKDEKKRKKQEEIYEEEDYKEVYHVKAKRGISSVGLKYKEPKPKTANKPKQGGQKKGSKQSQKKKKKKK